MGGLTLPKEGIYVIWGWNSANASGDKAAEDSDKIETSVTETLSDNESDTTISDEDEAIMTHTVTFKCIGASKSADAQQALRKVSEKLRLHQHVSVDIFPEPDNPFDSRAIAFKALIDHHWYTVGYVVREAVEHVHGMLESNKIESVNFSWAKYMVTWSRSGPGYYAGINIRVKGKWPAEVVHCASTR